MVYYTSTATLHCSNIKAGLMCRDHHISILKFRLAFGLLKKISKFILSKNKKNEAGSSPVWLFNHLLKELVRKIVKHK
jgi:hypothetical protein